MADSGSDDEGLTRRSSSSRTYDIAYVPDDTTTDIAWPPRVFAVLPCVDMDALERASFVTLPHSRTGVDTVYALVHTGTDLSAPRTLCEVQQQSPKYSAWFLGDRCEPNGALYIATPFDASYLAMWLLLAGQNVKSADVANWLAGDKPEVKFRDLHTLLGEDARLSAAPREVIDAIAAALPDVSEVRKVPLGADEEEAYYRLDVAKVAERTKARFAALAASRELRDVVYAPPPTITEAPSNMPRVETQNKKRVRPPPGAEEAPSQLSAASELLPGQSSDSVAAPVGASVDMSAEEDHFLKLRAFEALLDYIPPQLHTALYRHCGLEAARTEAKAVQSQAHVVQRDELCGADTEMAKKKNRAEQSLKSQSVKRLEKKGPPKGTPTLMSMMMKAKK